ncbi:MAG: hypothetical protein HC915_14760 [Anaerolineae bacterium]|nr:hypothetical protein [Anaerolineae bacterium]
MESSQQQPASLEERLQPWLDQGEYVLVLVITLMAWVVGWVDLLAGLGRDPLMVGSLAVPVAVPFALFSLGFIPWVGMVFTLRGLAFFRWSIGFVQARPWLFALMLAGFGALLYSMSSILRWASFPLLQVALMIIMLQMTLLCLLARPQPDQPLRRWQQVVLALLGGLLLLEGALQAASVVGVAPLENTSGLTVPYGRIVTQTGGNALTNRYGWYYPDFALAEETYRIALTGDTYVQALQVPQAAHMGQQLQQQLADAEVLALGMLGYGPGLYADTRFFTYIWQDLDLAEIVVLFHLANDFQVAEGPGGARPTLPWAQGAAWRCTRMTTTPVTLLNIRLSGAMTPPAPSARSAATFCCLTGFNGCLMARRPPLPRRPTWRNVRRRPPLAQRALFSAPGTPAPRKPSPLQKACCFSLRSNCVRRASRCAW